MARKFEVRWTGVLPATPDEAWDALTSRGSAWLWDIEYEPQVGGAERGLNEAGGTVTAWDPPRHFATRANEGFNELEYRLTPHPDGTHVDYVHRGEIEGDYEVELDACRSHTAFYYRSLAEYLRHFGGRDAAYMSADLEHTTFDSVRGTVAALGEVEYEDDRFLSVRTGDAFIRVFGRDAWGWPVGIAVHAFENRDAWAKWLEETFATEAVA